MHVVRTVPSNGHCVGPHRKRILRSTSVTKTISFLCARVENHSVQLESLFLCLLTLARHHGNYCSKIVCTNSIILHWMKSVYSLSKTEFHWEWTFRSFITSADFNCEASQNRADGLTFQSQYIHIGRKWKYSSLSECEYAYAFSQLLSIYWMWPESHVITGERRSGIWTDWLGDNEHVNGDNESGQNVLFYFFDFHKK